MGKIVKYPESDITKEIERDGSMVIIQVYKSEEKGGGWILEIVDEGWNSTAWDDIFESSQEALDAGTKAIEEEGIQAFIFDSKA